MQSSSPTYPDLIIEDCIPSCRECPSIWTNEKIGHRILCRCKKCKHGEIEGVDKSGDLEVPPRSRQVYQQQVEVE
jgi:hypothetical protein